MGCPSYDFILGLITNLFSADINPAGAMVDGLVVNDDYLMARKEGYFLEML